ncbi:MAG: DUF1320 domain-containing protein [Syntrophobacteraceae bacterium]|jgi:phage gp36-like protein|nr:DUF1320 domain-containing protein [Syntrophobacteraceae bacterium]
MPYCTPADIRDRIDLRRLVQLTDDEGEGIVDDSRIEKAIADADNEIDGYVGIRHAVPLPSPPPLLNKLSADLAVYHLYSRRGRVPEVHAERYRKAAGILEQIALGKISLGGSDPDGNPPASDAPEMSCENPSRLFTRSSMHGF